MRGDPQSGVTKSVDFKISLLKDLKKGAMQNVRLNNAEMSCFSKKDQQDKDKMSAI